METRVKPCWGGGGGGLIGVGGVDDESTDTCCGDAEARLWGVAGWLGGLCRRGVLLLLHWRSVQ